MTERAEQLHATVDGQVAGLIALIATLDEAMLLLPCPGREKLGDGTVAASVRHTADNYERIAGFVQSCDRTSGALRPTPLGAHRIPRFLRNLGHGPSDHAAHDPSRRDHDDQRTADNLDLDAVMERLSASRHALDAVAELSDLQLDSIPPKDSFRFCDGQRTLEQVLAGLLKHQRHQLDALRAVSL